LTQGADEAEGVANKVEFRILMRLC
jgi:hypothetical protein